MEREELEHLIRAASDVTNEYEFIIVGSQSILGPIPNPPAVFKMSAEADMYPRNAPDKWNLIDVSMGEGSDFHTTHRYYAQGVGPETAWLPDGWEDRLHRVQSANTDLKVGWCLDVLDLFMAKAYAARPKDRAFAIELMRHGYVLVEDAVQMVALMSRCPDEDKRALRARIKRWALSL